MGDQGVRRLAKAAGLPLIRLNDLRHSYASSALAAGIPIEVLSKRLGHSRISITQDVHTAHQRAAGPGRRKPGRKGDHGEGRPEDDQQSEPKWRSRPIDFDPAHPATLQ